MRYLNASDVCKLLGPEYGFHWTNDSDIQRIVFNKFQVSEVKKAIEFLPETDLVETLQQFKTETDILKIKKVLKKRKIDIPSTESELIHVYKKSELEHIINLNKKEITNEQLHIDYSKNITTFSEKLPPLLQKVVTQDFNKERGNVEESRIIKSYELKKTNELKYLTFLVNNEYYKIGCRFDAPGIEIKTRTKKFLGIPDYEKVQLHIYMEVSKESKWILKEKYNDQIIDHEILFDEFYFNKMKTDIHNRWEHYLFKGKHHSLLPDL
jgi:hypothetical protein